MSSPRTPLAPSSHTWLEFGEAQRLLLDTWPGIALRLDLQGTLQWINATGAQRLGHAAEAISGQPLAGTLLRQEDIQRHADALSKERGETVAAEASLFYADTPDGETSEWPLRHHDGSPHPTRLNIGPLRDHRGEVVGLLAIEPPPGSQTDRLNLVHHDNLTGLPTRATLADRAEMALQRAVRQRNVLAVALVEIVGFDNLSKEYGHSVGDDILRATAGRLHFELRKTDTAAPLDRGQFAVMLVDLRHPDEARAVAEKIQKALSNRINVGVAFVPLLARVGVAWYPDHGDQLLPLLQAAEGALGSLPAGQGGVATAVAGNP